MSKLNLQLRERVAIHSTGSDLDGKIGNNLGLGVIPSDAHYPDYYIIMLDIPTEDRLAIVITEACLARVQ